MVTVNITCKFFGCCMWVGVYGTHEVPIRTPTNVVFRLCKWKVSQFTNYDAHQCILKYLRPHVIYLFTVYQCMLCLINPKHYPKMWKHKWFTTFAKSTRQSQFPHITYTLNFPWSLMNLIWRHPTCSTLAWLSSRQCTFVSLRYANVPC